MNFNQAKKQFFSELLAMENCRSKAELIEKLGKTTIRCCWVDYVDYLTKDHQVSEKVTCKWGQVI